MTQADELKSSGPKATLPRIKILEMFQKTERRHMAAEILQPVARQDLRGTGHRLSCFDAFEQAGILSAQPHFEPASGGSNSMKARTTNSSSCAMDGGRVGIFFDGRIASAKSAALIGGFRFAGSRPVALRRVYQARLSASNGMRAMKRTLNRRPFQGRAGAAR